MRVLAYLAIDSQHMSQVLKVLVLLNAKDDFFSKYSKLWESSK